MRRHVGAGDDRDAERRRGPAGRGRRAGPGSSPGRRRGSARRGPGPASGRNQRDDDAQHDRRTPHAAERGRRAREGPAPSRRGVPQRDDDTERDRPDDPPRRPRRVLRGGRAARPPRAARAAGRRRRRRRRGRRGVVSAASYEARRFGIHSAMSMREAVPPLPRRASSCRSTGRRYQQASRDVMAILRRFTPLVEPISIDEAFLDVTGSDGAVRRRPDDRPAIKDEVRERGRADGLGRRRDDQARRQDRLGPAQARRAGRRACRRGGRLPRAAADRDGCGASARRPARRPGRIRRPDDRRPRRRCRRTSSSAGSASTGLAGRSGARAWTAIRSTRATRRNRSATSTRSTSTRAIREVIERTLLAMAEGVAGRLRSAGVRAGTVAVKVRDTSFRTITRQRTLAEPTDLTEPIYPRGARSGPARGARHPRPAARGDARRTSASASSSACSSVDDPRRRRAVEAADALRRRYGEGAVTRARLLGAGLPAPFERDPRNPLDRRARGACRPTPDRAPTTERRPPTVTA